MLSLMLDGQGLRAFVLCLCVGREQGVSIVEKHDEKTISYAFEVLPLLTSCGRKLYITKMMTKQIRHLPNDQHQL
jgi:hypothetical protein